MKPKRPSQYSNHFEIYKEKATCKTCGDVISYAGRQTSGMKRHAEGKHGIKFGEPSSSGLTPPEEKKMKINPQSSLDNFVRIKKRPLEEIVSKEAIKGVSFNYIATSEIIQYSSFVLISLGYDRAFCSIINYVYYCKSPSHMNLVCH